METRQPNIADAIFEGLLKGFYSHNKDNTVFTEFMENYDFKIKEDDIELQESTEQEEVKVESENNENQSESTKEDSTEQEEVKVDSENIIDVDVVEKPAEQEEEKEESESTKEDSTEVQESTEQEEVKVDSENIIDVDVVEKPAEQEEEKEESENNEKQSGDNITMQNRKVSPIKVMPSEKGCPINIRKLVKDSNENTEEESVTNKDEQQKLNYFTSCLDNLEIQYTTPERKDTGLYELDLIQNNGTHVTISADISGIIYDKSLKFFINPTDQNGIIRSIIPGDEYSLKPIFLTKKSIEAIKNGQMIPNKYIVSESLFNLNRFVDLQSLKEVDTKKRAKVFETVSKILSDDDIIKALNTNLNGKPFRFAFSRYNSVDEFSIVTSKRNRPSNLSDEKLNVDNEIWINVTKDKKDGKIQFNLTTRAGK